MVTAFARIPQKGTGSSAPVRSLLFVGLMAMCSALLAQTGAGDVLYGSYSGVGAYLAESGIKLAPVRVYTGDGKKFLTVETGLDGTTIYSDGDVGPYTGRFGAGKVGMGPGIGFGGTITTRRTNLAALVTSSPSISASGSTTNNGSASTSAHASVQSFAISTGGTP